MPTLETALFTYLSTDPDVSSLVGNRIYPYRMPEGCQLPCISWRRVGASRIYTHDSFDETAPWVAARVQFDCWAITALEAVRIGEAMLLALSGYAGDMSGQLIGASSAELEMDLYEDQTKLYRRVLDFRLMYEDAPAIGS